VDSFYARVKDFALLEMSCLLAIWYLFVATERLELEACHSPTSSIDIRNKISCILYLHSPASTQTTSTSFSPAEHKFRRYLG